ncbi:hypothetical protein AQ946_05690 [Burkholderia pseudomallei]|nr:hypothetical protein AQ766_28280 [Burkholderia pseudomallei]ONE15051.1 hypothetical protein AQ946_05690 [Burkholderia pseudomallei]ONE40769.1 hypothetical protein AQ948_12600 [Burkholderia pseudomallei]ONE41890.1 hypothetical protein AQ947_09930 [Burkholderia pseudomallei]
MQQIDQRFRYVRFTMFLTQFGDRLHVHRAQVFIGPRCRDQLATDGVAGGYAKRFEQQAAGLTGIGQTSEIAPAVLAQMTAADFPAATEDTGVETDLFDRALCCFERIDITDMR